MAATEQLHPDDRPPDPTPRRGIPRGLLWALALAVVVLTIASWMALSTETASTGDDDVARLDNGVSGLGAPDADLQGREAPGFALTSLSGGGVVLSDLRGKPTVVNFWNSRCTPCIEEMPALEQLHQRYGERVEVVGVASADVGEGAAREMVARTGVTYPSGYDASGNVLVSFGTTNLPATYVLDADGIVRYQHTSGAVPMDELAAELDRLIA